MAVSDKEYYQLTISINKALNPVEAALKHKHARAAIINTFRTQGAQSLWAVLLRQPLQENRFTAWKFCHLLHKILREGHHLCVQHSLRHRTMMTELGKLWGHLTDGYGTCIQKYTKLLVTKLEFHERNPRFPGNLVLQKDELDQIAGNDINNHFQLAVEMFDYLDDILALQSTIFDCVSKTSAMQCHQCLLAVIPMLVEEADKLYESLFEIMIQLHLEISHEELIAHQRRFNTLFYKLKTFYEKVKNVQFLEATLNVPTLDETPPDFLLPHYNSNSCAILEAATVLLMPEELYSMQSTNFRDSTQSSKSNSAGSFQDVYSLSVNDKMLQERDEKIQCLEKEISHLKEWLRVLTLRNREEVEEMGKIISMQQEEIFMLQDKLSEAEMRKGT